MARHRDLGAFDERSSGYESGWLGELHHRICEASLEIALESVPRPRRVLDVGCGTGYLLRRLAQVCAGAEELVGVDPAPGMIETAAAAAAGEARLRFQLGVVERLPLPDRSFDLVVSTTSFDHWADQPAGLAECARVLEPGGRLVLTDLFSALLLPTVWTVRGGRARTVRRASAALLGAGFSSLRWHRLGGVTPLAGLLVGSVTAVR